jgi:phosphogluconate dehydratase
MEMSLFSRDAIAMATAIALSHNMFDAALYLGVCDKIVPGLLIGALHFGHLPAVFVPAGPMTSGMSQQRQGQDPPALRAGKVGRAELLEAESKSYHGAGTCTFYGTANSNQMLMEAMGLHLPGAAFITPNTPLRDALTAAAAKRRRITDLGTIHPVGRMIDEKAIVNAIVALLATGGSTNHTLHLVAIAKAAGIVIDWDDFDELSAVVPLLTAHLPERHADVNHFHAAGGTGFVIRELLDAGLLHDDVTTILGQGLRQHCAEPMLATEGENGVRHRDLAGCTGQAATPVCCAPWPSRFADGGLVLLQGNLGRAVIKVSAVKPEHRTVEAPALVFNSQEASWPPSRPASWTATSWP